MHTLFLLGELDHASAHRLEAEIERICETGVKGITLDLSELTYIDATGVAVIVFRSRLCQRRGHEFALIPGGPFVQRAFELAGVSDSLAFVPGDHAHALESAPTSTSGRAVAPAPARERERPPAGALRPPRVLRPPQAVPEAVASAMSSRRLGPSLGGGDPRRPRVLGLADGLNLRGWSHPDPC
jgi:anti-anti-sigma factor